MIRTVADVPATFDLVTDSQQVQAVGESTGRDLSEYRSLFVEILEGEYVRVLGCYSVAPWLTDRVYDALDVGFNWDALKQTRLEV